ncbi:MAG: hypothetical protein PHQ40_12260 [Anaerolineaceae bacterium]|nr:hypothetical protein [Anaerolineaceae bacterium]
MQRDFLHDLMVEAKHSGYLFVIWFILVDYERLQETVSAPPDDAGWIWANTGLFD